MKNTALNLAICATLVVAMGCTKDDTDPQPGSDAGLADMTGDASNGSDAAVDMGSEPDTSTPDMPVNPTVCDPIGQNCVEAGASKCEARYENMMFSYTCGAAGTAGVGESCERPNGIVGEDTCAGGLFCTSFGLPPSDPEQRRCVELCSANAPCADDTDVCLGLSAQQPYGTCVAACDPLDVQCPDGTKCGSYYSPIPDQTVWVCDPDSGAAVGAECTFSSECGAGQSCSRLVNQDTNVCNSVCGDDSDCPNEDFCEIGPFQLEAGLCFTPDWSCIGNVVVAAPSAAEVDVPVIVRDDTLLGTGGAVAGATVNVCAADDVDCATPLDTQMTDANGVTTLTVPTGTDGFTGYFEVSATDRTTTLGYSSLPLTETPLYGITIQMFPTDQGPYWDAVTIDNALGSVVAGVLQCLDPDVPPLLGGRVSMTSSNADGATVAGYAPATYELSRFDQQLTATTFAGVAGLVNHPVGETTLVFTKNDGVETASRTVLVRAGAVTSVEVFPTP